MELSERMLDFIDKHYTEDAPVKEWAAEVALLEAKLTAIECGDCGLTMLVCKCDDLEDG